MTTTTAIDWNAWRASYDEMTFADQQEFYDRVFEEFPEQARFSTRVLGRLLTHIVHIPETSLDVVELGGWNGGFASETLADYPEIASWTNHEVSAAAVEASVCDDARFRGKALQDWYWHHHHVCDIFVSSHVLEHLKLVDVLRVFDVTSAKWMYLQSPLGEDASDWTNYRGSHVLEVGWRVLVEELDAQGYDLLTGISEPWARCFERRT